jgi:hypothetical protein
MSDENEDGTEDLGQDIIVETEEDSSENSNSSRVKTAPEAGDDEELSSYSKGVQQRISKLTERYRKEQRDREEATRLSQTLLSENQQLKARVQALDTGYISEYGARLQTQEAAVKNAYRAAHETGDTEAMLAAQEDLAKIVVERQRYATAKSRSEAQAEQAAAPRQQAAPQQAPQAPTPDPRAQSWAEKNKWFGEDRVMTTAAFAIHQELIDEQGFDPASNEYYTEIDRRIRSEFPHKFAAKNPGGGSQVASAVSSASRNTKQERRTVRLTPSQVAMAKRLNVPLDQYAKYVKD